MPDSSHAPELHAARKCHPEVRSRKGDGDCAAEPRLANHTACSYFCNAVSMQKTVSRWYEKSAKVRARSSLRASVFHDLRLGLRTTLEL